MQNDDNSRSAREKRSARNWHIAAGVLAALALLLNKFPFTNIGDLNFVIFILIVGISGLFWMIGSFYGKAGYSNELAAALGLRRTGFLLFHSSNSARLTGATEGLPVELHVYNDTSASDSLYGLNIKLTVNNPGCVTLAICDKGLLNRPAGFFPPEAEQRPEWMIQRGLRLLAEPASALPALLDKLELFAPFTADKQHFIHLKSSTLEISIKRRTTEYGTEEIRDLLTKAVKAARIFN